LKGLIVTTATTEQPFFRTVDDPWAERQPQNSRLRLPIEPTCELTPELNDKVSDYFDDANTLEAAIAKLHSDRAKLCADHAKSIMQVVQGGEDLLGRQSELSHELTALLWRRFALLNELVPAHRKALEAARVEADAAIRSELSKYAQYGLTPETMPAAQQGRLDQAEIQLRYAPLRGAPAWKTRFVVPIEVRSWQPQKEKRDASQRIPF
jgi:hypothetical protein